MTVSITLLAAWPRDVLTTRLRSTPSQRDHVSSLTTDDQEYFLLRYKHLPNLKLFNNPLARLARRLLPRRNRKRPPATMATTTTPGLPSPSLSPETKTKQQTDPSSPQKPRRSLRILCFGDSLTSGYSQLGAVSHPYSQRLTSVLSASFPSLNIDAHTDGLPGDLVCTAGSRFLRRIEPKFLTKGGGTPYDWTVVLGGTNDLAFQFTAEDIYKALRDVWDVALSKGGRVLACTVPEAGAQGKIGQRVKARRDELNELILSHRQENL